MSIQYYCDFEEGPLKLKVADIKVGGTYYSTSLVSTSTCTQNFFVVPHNVFNVAICMGYVTLNVLVSQYKEWHTPKAHITSWCAKTFVELLYKVFCCIGYVALHFTKDHLMVKFVHLSPTTLGRQPTSLQPCQRHVQP